MAASVSGPNVEAPAKPRVPVLDGIRGICALAVVVTHVAFMTIVLPSVAGDPPEGFWSIIAAGQVGAIGPFFVMSGLFLYRPFVKMTLAGAPRPALGQFFLRRGARLLPGFWLLAAFCLLVLNFTSIDSAWYVLRPFLLMEIYDFQYYAGMDVVWTVPTEIQFYLALPILAWIGHRFARGATDPAKKARRLLYPLLLLVVVQLGWTAYVHGSFVNWPPQYFYPFGVAGLFAVGMAMAIWTVLREQSPKDEPRFFGFARKHPNLFWLGAIAVYAINCTQPFAIAGTNDWLGPEAAVIRSTLLLSFSFLIMVPLVVPGATSRTMTAILGGRVTRFLGTISYGIYLWHFAVMYLFFRSGSIFGEIIPVQMQIGRFGYWELIVPTVLGTVVAATISYYVLERPVFRFVERRVKQRNARAVATATDLGAPRNDVDVQKAA
jgi:peptidoglycan/LPS O-acetylase OafA/YrhL